MNVLVDQFGNRFVERKLKSDTIFYIVVGKDQPTGRMRSARLDQVLLDLDSDRLPSRMGANDRIAIATAIWAAAPP